jgi:hypothetical protein
MIRTHLMAASLFIGALTTVTLQADEIETVHKDGVKYQRVRQVTQRPISETHYEPQEHTSYNPRYTTEYQHVERTYQVPVTEQQWVPGYQRTLNIFAPPVLSYRLRPVTRWETRVHTVRVPKTRVDYVPQKVVRQVPVTTQRLAQEEHTHLVPIGLSDNGAALVADRNGATGGTKLDSDPPRQSSGGIWRSGSH